MAAGLEGGARNEDQTGCGHGHEKENATPIGPGGKIVGAQKRTREQKEKREEASKLRDRAGVKKLAQVVIQSPPAPATPLHSVALRAASVS